MKRGDTENILEDGKAQRSSKPTGRVKRYLLAAKIVATLVFMDSVYWAFVHWDDDPLWDPESIFNFLEVIFGFLALVGALIQILFLVGLVGLVINRLWAITVVSIYGRICMIFLLIGLFVDITMWPVGIWSNNYEMFRFFVHLLLFLFLSSLDYIPSVREYAGLRHHSPRRLVFRAGGYLAFPAIIWLVYAILVINLIPPEVRNLKPRPFNELKEVYSPPTDPTLYRWQPDYGFYLKEDMKPIKKDNEDLKFPGWKDGLGGSIIISKGYVTPDELLKDIGVDSPFAYEKAMWSAGFFNGQFLIFKAITRPNMSNEAIYLLEDDTINAVVHYGRWKTKWATSSHIFPSTGPYVEIRSNNPDLNKALAPVMMTIERYRNSATQ